MNISQLAKANKISTDTVRYYEKQNLLGAPPRQDNGYRVYTDADVETVRFVRGAQALGFTLAEIRTILPQLAAGQFGRTEIEQQLQSKMAQIDTHMRQLRRLKKELAATFASLRCSPSQVVTTGQSIAPDFGSGVGVAIARLAFSRTRAHTAG